MGLSGLKSQGSNFSGVNQIDYSNHFTAFRDGYLTNLLNPKALVYFVSVISPFVRPGEENILYAAVGFIFTIMTFIWFSFLAVSLNTFVVRKLFEKYACYIDRFFSIVILGLACYMLYHEIQKFVCVNLSMRPIIDLHRLITVPSTIRKSDWFIPIARSYTMFLFVPVSWRNTDVHHKMALSCNILIFRYIICQRVNALQHTIKVQQTITIAKDIISCQLYMSPGHR